MRVLRTRAHSSGFTMLELLISIAIMGVMVTAAVIEMQPLIPQMHADSAADLLLGQIRMARQLAIAQRRDFKVQFLGNNEIKITRQEIPVGTTVISDIFLPQTVDYMLFGTQPDTPDGFGRGASICFGTIINTCTTTPPPIMQFQSDGTFIDANGNLLSGTVFIGVANIPTTARAITILGATGQVRMYKGTGAGWVQQ